MYCFEVVSRTDPLMVVGVCVLKDCLLFCVEELCSALPPGRISFRFVPALLLCRWRSKDKPYEYVMVDSPRLASVSADGRPFADHIASGEGDWRRGWEV